MQLSGRLSRSLETRAGVLAAVVLTVLTGGAASAVALEESALSAGPGPASAAVSSAVSSAVTVAPRVLVETDLVVSAAWEVAPTSIDAPLAPVVPAEPPAAEQPAVSAAAADPLCSGDGWQQRRGQAALASLRRPADADAFRLSFEPGRPGVIGLAAVDQGRLQVFVRSCAALTPSLLRHVVAHEVGHLVDGARMTDDVRTQWLAVRGIPADTPWYGCNSCTDFATPAGDFAEVYAQWQTGAGGNRSELAGSPSAAELADLAARFF